MICFTEIETCSEIKLHIILRYEILWYLTGNQINIFIEIINMYHISISTVVGDKKFKQ